VDVPVVVGLWVTPPDSGGVTVTVFVPLPPQPLAPTITASNATANGPDFMT
jgi:hypothetical protein